MSGFDRSGLIAHVGTAVLGLGKLLGVLSWSWWVVFAPMVMFWGYVVAVMGCVAWEIGRHGMTFPCGHPRVVAGVEDVRCSVCDRANFQRGNPGVMGP